MLSAKESLFVARLERQAADERQSPRYRLLLESEGQLSDYTVVDVAVHDISARGLLIEVDAALEIGSLIVIDLPGQDQLSAHVIRVDGSFVAVSFPIALSLTSLKAILAAAPLVWLKSSAHPADRTADRVIGTASVTDIHIDRWPPHRRLQFITVSSLLLWSAIGIIVWLVVKT